MASATAAPGLDGHRVAVFRVDGMTCGACSSTVERALSSAPCVREASVSCITHKAHVIIDPGAADAISMLLGIVEDVGFEAQLLEETVTPPKSRLSGHRLAVFRVEGMTCSACSSTVERALSCLPFVLEASVSCVTHRANVRMELDAVDSINQVLTTVEDVGFEARLLDERVVEQHAATEPSDRSQASTSRRYSAEIDARGMVGPGASSQVEEQLRLAMGVERVSACAALGRVFVVYDEALITLERILEDIRGLGFEPQTIQARAEPSGAPGRASLALTVTPVSSGRIRVRGQACESATFEDSVLGAPGVVGCRRHPDRPGVRVISYDVSVVGARKLLRQLQTDLDDIFTVDFVSANLENEELTHHTKALKGLRRDLVVAAPLAFFVFLITMLLPILGFGMGDLGLLSRSVHHSITVLTLVIFALATPVHFGVGRRFHSAAYRAIRRKSPNMDVLVSVATNTAYFYSLTLIAFCLVTGDTLGARNLAAATHHFLTMGPVLIAVVLLGKCVEGRAKLSAIRALTDLPSSMPAVAMLCSDEPPADGTAAAAAGEIPVELVEIADVLRIYAGSKVPVDGRMCSETPAYMDESLLTGESTPVLKKFGDQLLGGSTCVSVGCLLRVTKVGSETMLGQMVSLVQAAQASKAQVQRTADRVARVFVPTVVVMSFCTFLVWLFLVLSGIVSVPELHGVDMMPMMQSRGGMTVGGPPQEGMVENAHIQLLTKVLFAMKFGMAVMMIACPCAMGLATPMAVMVATGVAAKRGCLVKSAAALEASAKLDAIVLDKTGTITRGCPAVQAAAMIPEAFERSLLGPWRAYQTAIARGACASHERSAVPLSLIAGESYDKAMTDEMENCFWWLLGTVESASDHPVAKCISSHVRSLSHLPPISPPSNFEYLSGMGMRCVVEELGGAVVRLGNLRLYKEVVTGGVEETDAERELLKWFCSMQDAGNTVVVLHAEGRLLGAAALRDPVREDAVEVVRLLSQHFGLEVWMCTGDNNATANRIAREVGIQHVVGEALPATKRECVQALQRPDASKSGSRRRRVCFIGDGINDSLALAQADVGLAIGVGAQVAVEAADVALVRSELMECVNFLSLSRRTLQTICLNFFWAFCFNFVCLPLAAGMAYPKVHIPPLTAGVGMACSSCLVVVTSLALQLHRPLMASAATAPRRWKGSDPEERAPLKAMPHPPASKASIIGRRDLEAGD